MLMRFDSLKIGVRSIRILLGASGKIQTDRKMCSATRQTHLELQSKWPYFNTNSSFFSGNSPFFLHFQ